MLKLTLSALIFSAAIVGAPLSSMADEGADLAASPSDQSGPQTIPVGSLQTAPAASPQLDTKRAALERARRERYEELRSTARILGVDLPETPPWSTLPASGQPTLDAEQLTGYRKILEGLTPEQREAVQVLYGHQPRFDATVGIHGTSARTLQCSCEEITSAAQSNELEDSAHAIQRLPQSEPADNAQQQNTAPPKPTATPE